MSQNALANLFGQNAAATPVLATYAIQNRVYKNNTIFLDGYSFVNCVFIGCTLVCAKGTFSLKDCHIQSGSLYYQSEALKIVRLSSILMDNWNHLPEGLRATIEPDGGFTIE